MSAEEMKATRVWVDSITLPRKRKASTDEEREPETEEVFISPLMSPEHQPEQDDSQTNDDCMPYYFRDHESDTEDIDAAKNLFNAMMNMYNYYEPTFSGEDKRSSVWFQEEQGKVKNTK